MFDTYPAPLSEGAPVSPSPHRPIPRPPSSYGHLPFWQFRNLVNGAAFAASQGWPMALHCTLVWKCAENFDPAPRAWMARQGEVLASLWSWLTYHDQPTAYLWAKEGGSNYGCHTHLVLHLDPALRDDLHRHLIRAGRFLPYDGKGTVPILITPHNRPCMTGPAEWGGLLRYLGKTLSPEARTHDGLVMPGLGIHDHGRSPCHIEGKRTGLSRTIAATARAAAGWRELTTLPELRAVLDGGGLRHAA